MKRTILLIVLSFLTAVPASAQSSTPLLPDVAGWSLTLEPTVYKPDNLWDLIDGAADLFLEYNFVDLRLGRYMNRDSVEIKVELYRHASGADAFGIYSQERYTDYHFLDIGVQGYMEKGVLNFLAGIYYVKISSVQTSEDVQEGLLVIARKVESHLQQPKAWPKMLAVFPKKDHKENADQYIAKSYLGYSYLNGAYVATYENQSSFKSFIIETENPDAALKLLATYLEGIKKEEVSRPAENRIRVTDPHNGIMEWGWKGKYLFGAYADESGKSKLSFLQELAAHL